MKLNKVWIAAAAVMMVGGSAAGVLAYGANQDADSDEMASLDQAAGQATTGTEQASTSATANEGVEQYRGGGRGFGGHGYGGRGWGGRGWGGRGWGGRGWGWGRGYRGYCGWYCW